jgi:hypothetical protein
MEQAKMQAEMQIEQMKAQLAQQLEASKQQHEANLKMQELSMQEQFDRWKADLDAATKIMVARIGANPGIDVAMMEAEDAAKDTVIEALTGRIEQNANNVAALHNHVADMHEQMMQTTQDALQRSEELARMAHAPKRIVRGPDGRAIGVEVVQAGTMQ